MGTYRILHYVSASDNAVYEEYEWGEIPISSDAISTLHNYYKILGVVAIQKDKDDKIAWELNNYWYSSEQIERMMKIKVFG
jgi:hypothetical protein